MFNVTSYPAGTFSWVDCTTTDPAAAKAFYTGVFGWDAVDMPAGEGRIYTMFTLDGLNVAGMGEMQDAQKEQGIPSHWMNYVTVNDVDAMPERVTNLGGNVILPPMDVFDNGRMMILQDTVGAQMALWQAGTHIGSDVVNKPGAVIWNELQTTDPATAATFYKGLFDWDISSNDAGDYHYISNNGRMNGGILSLDADTYANVPPHWMVYFNVADIQAALKKANSLGGKALMDISEAQGVGQFVMVQDPAGATLTIMQAQNPEPWQQSEEVSEEA